MARVIKTEVDYKEGVARLHELLDRPPAAGTPESDEVELLAVLLSDYEQRSNASLALPSPLDAIRFRMEQLRLSQRDLVPFVGSPSKASEVLSGKRALSLNMIRALHTGLGIPARVLLQQSTGAEGETLPWGKFPLREMIRRGWLSGTAKDLTRDPSRAIRVFLSPLHRSAYSALLHQSEHIRTTRDSDRYAVLVWLARVVSRAQSAMVAPPIDDIASLMAEVVKFSSLQSGPRIAIEFLAKNGIPVIVEPHLPRTYVDGACIFTDQGPVIGLTLRHDRLDNFWFTLLHELSHAALHATSNITVFIDDVEASTLDASEKEADDLARRSLIPEDIWTRSPASRLRSRQAVEHLAREMRIHPAIVAGRIRRQYNDYSVLGDMVGRGEVRKLFPDFARKANIQ